MTDSHGNYFIPEPSRWPLVASTGLFVLLASAAMALNGHGLGTFGMGIGVAIVFYMFYGWFHAVHVEGSAGNYSKQVDLSFRWGMAWFIISEVMFFAAFFGALFYARVLSVPWLGGEGSGAATHEFLFPAFQAAWPLIDLPDINNGTAEAFFTQTREVIGPWGLPAINTLILLSSGATVTWAHWGLLKNNRRQLVIGLLLTVFLGSLFLGLQAEEYAHAYSELDLKLSSGIYGATFFMLTGFHGFHVTMGTIMLAIILIRSTMGHFSAEHHFGFEAVAWYWHFVDVVWLGLFIFVYWL